MAVKTITYGDKSYLNQNAEIPATNKVQDTDMNEIKSVVNNNALELTNITGQILWTNPNPTVSFSSQTITLSTNDYDMLLWVFSTGTSNSQYISFYTIKGKGVYASWVYNNTFLAREINYSTDTQYSVGDNKTNGTTNNVSTIPQYVIGYKTGLFD